MVQTIQKQQIIQMLIHSFEKSERISQMLRSSHRQHLRTFFNYIYVFIEQVGQIFVSHNQSTILLYFYKSKEKYNFKIALAKLRLVLFSLSWKNLAQTLRINSAIKSVRSRAANLCRDKDYIYVWFLAGKEQSINYSGLYEAMEHLKVESMFNGLPIYIETAVPRMIAVYERGGFKCYAQEQCGDQLIWFGKYVGHGK